jgi:hypothetical protein
MNRHLRRVFCQLLLGSLLLLLASCEKDDIRSYTAPRPPDDIGTGRVRLLAAIVPAGDDVWFVKLVGREDIVGMVEPTYLKLLDSIEVKAKADPSLTWKTPDKWKEDRGNPNRVATLSPEGVGKPEIILSKLPAAGGQLKPNVDRWRRVDLGLGPISGRFLSKVASKRKVGGVEIDLVDMRGPGVDRPATPKASPLAPPQRSGRLKYRTPPGWREAPPSSLLVAASLSVSEGDRTAKVRVTPLPGSMPGGLLANVNRWRDDVGLPHIGEDELKQLIIRTVKVGDSKASLIELDGKGQRSLVAWLEHKGTTWFFKFLGSAGVVTKQRDAFFSFLESVTFTGAADE